MYAPYLISSLQRETENTCYQVVNSWLFDKQLNFRLSGCLSKKRNKIGGGGGGGGGMVDDLRRGWTGIKI